MFLASEEEWNLWNDKLVEAYEHEEELILENANLRKELLENEFKQQYEEIEGIIFNGSTLDEEKEKLAEKRELLDEYISGLEKSYSLELLKNDLIKEEITDFDTEIALLEQKEKMTKEEYETLKKKIEIKKLENKLDNLKNQKTIQQLTKKEDGTYDYTYVVDQDAVDEAQNALTEARIDFINYNEDLELSAEEEELSNKEEYLNDIAKIQEKALNGEYKTQEEFVNAMDKLNDKLGTDYKGTWAEMLRGQIDSGIGISSQFTTMKNSYSSFTAQMSEYSNSLSTSMINTATEMTNAANSMADAIQRMIDANAALLIAQAASQQAASQQHASQAQQDRADNTYEEQLAEMEENNADGNIPNVNVNKVWNVGYISAYSGTPNVVITDSSGNVIPVIVTRTNDSNFAITPTSPYANGGSYTLVVDGTIQRFTTSATGSYKDGGIIDYQGFAEVHGSPSSSEVVFNSSQASKLYELVKNLPSFNMRNLLPNIQMPDISKYIPSFNKNNNQTSQVFNIGRLEFPNVRNSKDIENAIFNLPGIALQFAK